MMKKILIIGYGDIAERVHNQLDNNLFEIYGISRNNSKKIKNFIQWDWLASELPKIDNKIFHSLVFIPKPIGLDIDGYNDGFIRSSENIFKLSKKISFEKFISISSTRVYGNNKSSIPIESKTNPDDFRGKIILDYEKNQIKRYAEKLVILRFSGLYKSDVTKKPLNCLHRNNAAKAINYFIENDFNFSSYEIFNCSENSTSSINNDSKLKNTGLIFDSYD
jgi:nucleoside-diphosphate-sugar epimerase|tara:strand:- start:606 stop:1268 length:663 start_codon:yes stop_codon:yes gene_type:complete